MSDTATIIIPEPLQAKARELALPDAMAADMLRAYAPHAAAGAALKDKAASLDQVTPAAAREIRLMAVKVRTGSDKTRKELKADSMLRGKAIDGLHALIELEAVALERQMEDIEKAAERAEAARIAKLREGRLAKLRAYVADPSVYMVERMEESAFLELLESSRLAHAAREHARIAAEKAEAERIEAARLAAIEAERKRQEELAAAKAEAEAMRKKAAEEAEARRVADEKSRSERDAIEASAAAERKAAEEAAAKERARVEAERAEERARVAKIEAAAKAEADRKAADAERARVAKERADAAPDADKIEALSAAIRNTPIPDLSPGRAKQRAQIIEQRDKFASWLSGMAEKLRA